MSKSHILSKIKHNIKHKVALNSHEITPTTYKDKLSTFKTSLESVGGSIVFDAIENAKDYFNDEPLMILEASFAVAENGACFIKHDKNRDRKDYTFYENIAIILDKNSIVNNMYEAYEKVAIDDFGIFISGPSKTADIEQSLVIGAHGAKVAKIFLI